MTWPDRWVIGALDDVHRRLHKAGDVSALAALCRMSDEELILLAHHELEAKARA